jgi:hypothetical protein
MSTEQTKPELVRELLGYHSSDVVAMVIYYKKRSSNAVCRIIVGDIPRRDLALVALGPSWIAKIKRRAVNLFYPLLTRPMVASAAMAKNVGVWTPRDIASVRGEALKLMRSYSTF